MTKPGREGAAKRQDGKKEATVCELFKLIFLYCALIVTIFYGAFDIFTGLSKFETQTTSVTGEGEISIVYFLGSLDTVVCQSYNVTSVMPRDVYLTSGQAEVDRGQTENITRTADQLYPNETLNSFYLLEGSSIKLNVCRVNTAEPFTVDLLVFKGDDSWNKWKKNGCAKCNEKNVSLPLNTSCEDGRHVVLVYEVKERDTYYVTMAGREAGPKTLSLDVRAELKIAQTTFNVTGAQKICTNESMCDVPVRFGSDADIVLGRNRPLGNVQKIYTFCNGRPSFFLSIFVGIPLALMLLGSAYLIYSFISDWRKSARERNSIVNDRAVGVRDNYGLILNEV